MDSGYCLTRAIILITLRLMNKRYVVGLMVFVALLGLSTSVVHAQTTNPQSGAFGLTATLPTEAPKVAPTISVPRTGQSFSTNPVEVSGICQNDLLIKVFKNGIFTGSVMCAGNSFTLSVDLFSGKNDLTAQAFDALDQASPLSNTVTVTYNDGGDAIPEVNRVSLSSLYAKRGADPGSVLGWPVIITGGVGPYAVVVDWGDGATDRLTRTQSGEFTIEHTYASPGVYRMVVRATDSAGSTAYLQLVAQANGAIVESTTDGTKDASTTIIYRWIWWPILLLPVLMLMTFWLGMRYQFTKIKQMIRLGKYPFE